MITQEVADRYLEEKGLFESGELELSPDEVELRRSALAEFGEELERRQGRERGLWEKARAERVRRNFMDLETLGGNFGEAEAEQYRWAVDRDDLKAHLATKELLAAHYDLPLEEAGQKFDVLRADYANRHFGGKIPKTNVEFWRAAKERIEHGEAVEAETVKMIGTATADAFDGAMKGLAPNWGGSLQKWREGATGSVLVKERKPEELDEAYRAVWQGARDLMERNPALLEAARMMAQKARRADLTRDDERARGAGDEPELNPRQMQTRMAAGKLSAEAEAPEVETGAILDKLMEVPREDVGRFFDLLPAYLVAIGEPDPQEAVTQLMTQFWGEVAHGYSSMMGDRKGVQDQMTRDARVLRAIQEGRDVRVSVRDGGFVQLDRLVTEADVAAANAIGGFGTGFQTYSHSPEEYGRELTAAERVEVADRLARRVERGKFFFQVEEMTRQMRPLRAVTPFESAEMGLYAVAGSAPMMARGIAASFVPGVGPFLAFASSADAIKSQELQRLVAEFPDIDLERAEQVATISGLAQAVPELASTYGMRFGGSLLVRKAPALANLLSRASGSASAFVRPLVTRTGAGVAEEMTEEAVQGWLSATVQNAILTDYPEVDAKRAFLDNISPEVAFASLFMRLPAVGAGTWTESRAVRNGLKSREMMKALGLSDEAATQINQLAEGGEFQQAEALMRKEYGALKPEQIEAGARYMEQRMRVAREIAKDPSLPKIERRGERWSIVEHDGTVSATFESEEAAFSQYQDRLAWERHSHTETVRGYVDFFRARSEGRVFEEERRTRRVEGEEGDAPLDAEALAASMRMAKIEEGADPATLIVKGEAAEEIREGVYRDVVRLYQGADFTTVIEENAHAQLNADLREGRVTMEEAAQWAREWAQETGFELDDPMNPTRAEIEEAVADMAKAHFLNERKRLPDAPKVRGLMASLRAYLREVFGRAKRLIEMREAGRLSESAEGYLARTLGINEQVEVNRATAEAVGAITAVPPRVEVGTASFSIGVLDEDQKMPWREPRKAQRWALANLRGSYPNAATESEFVVNRETIRHTFNHSKMNGDKVRVLEAIGAIIREARPLKAEKPYERSRGGVVADQIFYAPVIVGGKPRMARLVVHRMDELSLGERQVYDVKSVEIEEAQLLPGPFPEKNQATKSDMLRSSQEAQLPQGSRPPLKEGGLPGMLRLSRNIEDFEELVKKAYPKDFESGPSHSIGRADYLSELATSLDAQTGSAERLTFAEKVRRNLERGRARVDLLERELIYEQQADERARQLKEDLANLQLRTEEGLGELRRQKAEQIEQAGTGNMAKFMDRIEAAKTERERTLLRREARETAADLKRGIEKDFKAQEKALRERFRGEEKVLREKALGAEKAARLKASHDEARAATLQSLVDYNAVMMALPAELRGKLGGFVTLARLKTDRARDKFFREKFPKIEAAYEKYLRDEYDAALKKIFKRAKPKKAEAGKRPSGKLGPELHALFAKLEEATGWDAAKLEGYIAELEQREADGTLTPEQEDLADLEKAMLNLVVDWKHADSGRRGTAVRELKALLSKGLTEYRFKKGQERIERKERRERLVAATGSTGSTAERTHRAKKDAGIIGKRLAFLRAARLNLSSFEQVLFLAFGENPEVQRVVDMERAAAYAKQDADHGIAEKVDTLLHELAGGRFAAQELHHRMTQKSMEVRGIALSELEAITVSMLWRQEDGRRHMEGLRDEDGNLTTKWSYDQAFVDEVEAKLTPEAMAVRDFLTAEYAAEYARVNAIYRALNGVDLPRHAFYSPITVKPVKPKAGEMVDPTTGVAMSAGSSLPGSLRTRGKLVAEPDFKDALLTFVQHKTQMNHWMAYAEFMREFQSLVGHRDVMNAVEASGGEATSRMLGQWLDYFAQGGNRDAGARLELVGFISKLVSNASAMAIVGRAGVLAVQSTQILTALAEMPTASYLKRMGMLASGQLGLKAAWDSPYIQRRLKEMPPVVRQLMEGLNSGTPTRIKYTVQMLGRSISGADALFTAGTYAIVYDYRLAKLVEGGLGRAQAERMAREEAERITDRLAQPMRAGARSMMELRMSGNPAFRMAWNFASEARKNLGVVLYAMARRDGAQAARTVMAMWVLQSLMANLIRAAWRDARDDEDDDIFDEKHWNAKRMALAVLVEPMAGIPVVGDLVEEAVYRGAGEHHFSGGLLELGRSVSAAKRLPSTLAGEQEAAEVLRDVEAMLMGMGLFSTNLAAAASLSHIVRDLYGAGENVSESGK